MKIFVKAKPSALKEFVEKVDDTHYIVSVKEPPVNGLANLAIRKALSDHLHIHQLNIRLSSGFSSRNKIFEIK